MWRLHNSVQPYAWGSLTVIPALLGQKPTGLPQAELWLGAHPSAPSHVRGVGGLDVLLRQAPERLLGALSVTRFGPELPFLLKVLAAAQPLSLQAHPNLEQAKAGFARDERSGIARTAPQRNYKDANHKPELICALSTFHLLCGFRSLIDSIALFRGLGLPFAQRLERDGLRCTFEFIMTLPSAEAQALIQSIVTACAIRPPLTFSKECAWALRLASKYPGDVGVIGALLLNHVILEAGDALFLSAGNLHAYLEGSGIEVMANSDNVLRGGLTSKHVDVAELLSVVDFTDGPARVLRPQGAPEAVYETPARDFCLSCINLTGSPVPISRRGAEVFLVTHGAVKLHCGTEKLELLQGESAFVGANEGHVYLDGDGRAFRATIG